VRQWQQFFYDQRYVGTPILSPDYVKLAEAYEIPACRVEEPGQVGAAVREANDTDGPFLIEFRVKEEVNVYPMIAPGAAVDDMFRRPSSKAVQGNGGVAPAFSAWAAAAQSMGLSSSQSPSDDMKYVLSAWMRDKPGVLHRVCGLLRRRNFNIDSLQVSHSEQPGISRMTFVVDGDEQVAAQVEKQMAKLVDVTRIESLSRTPLIARELALLRVAVTGQQRTQVLQLAEIFSAQVVDVSRTSMLLQIVGNQTKINALVELLQEFELLEMVRTGPVAIARKGNADVLEEDIALNGGPP